MVKKLTAMTMSAAFSLANLLVGTSPAQAATCSASAGDHCRAIVHWPVHAINGITYRPAPLVQCFSVNDPSVDFVTDEAWIGPDDETTWVEAGDAFGFPQGGIKYRFWAESDEGDYHEFRIADAVPNVSRRFDTSLDEDGKWRVRMEGTVVGTSTITGNSATVADAGTESTDPGAHIDAAINSLGYYDTAGNIIFEWNSPNFHPTFATHGNFEVGWITQFSSLAVSANVCSSSSPKSQPTTSSDTASAAEQGIEETLQRLSERNGERVPQSIEAVRISKSIAKFGSGTASETKIPVIAVQAVGNFVGHAAKIPAGKKLPHGKYLTVTIDESTGEVVDWGISSHPTNMAALGKVQTLR